MAKTRLTEGIRKSILNNIVQDIPRIDYDQIVQDYLNKRAYDSLPLAMIEFLNEHPNLKDLLGSEHLSSPFSCWVQNKRFTPTETDHRFCYEQREAAQEQRDRIALARKQIGVWLANANTIEALLESGPQFSKYIPKPEEKIEQLPAIQLAEELGKIGWPKQDG